MPNTPTIWVDADAAPRAVVDVLVRASARRGVDVILVANRWIDTPPNSRVRSVLVGAGADVADDHIAEHCATGDLIITADIPLAARAVERGATVVTPRGRDLTKENVQEALSLRNFKEELRDGGVMTGGPSPFDAQDKQRFSNALDRWLTIRARSA